MLLEINDKHLYVVFLSPQKYWDLSLPVLRSEEWGQMKYLAFQENCARQITPTQVMVYHWWILKYLVKRWFLPAATRARGQSNDLNREILASNLFNCRKEAMNAPPVPSISRCIHIVYRHKNVWEYQWSNFIYNCLSTFLHYVCCKDALLDCSAPGGERCESLTRDQGWWNYLPVPRLLLPTLELISVKFQGTHLNWCIYVLITLITIKSLI